MQLDTSTIMMVVFIVAFIVSIWKIYPFLQTKVLEDDDTTPESQDELIGIIQKYAYEENIDSKELFERVTSDSDFDKEHFWRFNENKLRQLLHKIN